MSLRPRLYELPRPAVRTVDTQHAGRADFLPVVGDVQGTCGGNLGFSQVAFVPLCFFFYIYIHISFYLRPQNTGS